MSDLPPVTAKTGQKAFLVKNYEGIRETTPLVGAQQQPVTIQIANANPTVQRTNDISHIKFYCCVCTLHV